MSLIRSGLHLLPISFFGMQTLAYAMFAGGPPRRAVQGADKRRRPNSIQDEAAECSALADYHMGCLAQSMSVCGFDVGAGRTCGCERSGDHCIRRMR